MRSCWWKFLRAWFAGRSTLSISSVRTPYSEVLFDYPQIPSQEDHRPERGARSASGILITEIAETDYVGGVAIVDRIAIQLFGLCYGILSPTQVHTSEVRLLRGQSNRRFVGLVADLHFGFGIDLGRHRIEVQRIDVHGGEESGGFYYSIPAERIDHVWICGDSDGIDSLIAARLQRGDGAAMLVIAKSPIGKDG